MSAEYTQNRKPTNDELRLIKFLIAESSIKLPNNWELQLTVKPMNDQGMGSLFLFLSNNNERKFGEQISECSFIDNDGVKVIASLNVDQYGELFELDIWKVDYTPLIKLPDDFNKSL